MVRALACHARGRGFKSRHSRHLFTVLMRFDRSGRVLPTPGDRRRVAFPCGNQSQSAVLAARRINRYTEVA